jgi:hypothetical protein
MGVTYEDGTAMPATSAIYQAATGTDLSKGALNLPATPEYSKLRTAINSKRKIEALAEAGTATPNQLTSLANINKELPTLRDRLAAAMKEPYSKANEMKGFSIVPYSKK